MDAVRVNEEAAAEPKTNEPPPVEAAIAEEVEVVKATPEVVVEAEAEIPSEP